MIALLKIQCPHCGSAGQILMPPPGAIIIGPCPECSKIVAIFAGEALALDDEIMNQGGVQDKYEHVMHVLSGYLETQVQHCFSKLEGDDSEHTETPEEVQDAATETEAPLITDNEFDHFVNEGLDDLDNSEFFKDFG